VSWQRRWQHSSSDITDCTLSYDRYDTTPERIAIMSSKKGDDKKAAAKANTKGNAASGGGKGGRKSTGDGASNSRPTTSSSVSRPRTSESKEGSSSNGIDTLSDNSYLHLLYNSQQEFDRVKALEQSHATLVATCAELHKSLQSMDAKHTHMFLYKQRESIKTQEQLEKLEQTISDLRAQNEVLRNEKVVAVSEAERKHAQAVARLEERMAIIQAKYDSLSQFQSTKSEMETNLETLRQALEEERRSHALNVSELERRNVMEKDRLKNEMLRKIRETKLSLLAMTEDQLHTTTKRTILENEQMTSELHYQSKETERIVKKNEKLIEENSKLKREIELSASTQQIMAKKTMFYQQLITKLQSKLDIQSAEREREQQVYLQAQQAWSNQLALAHAQAQQMQHQSVSARRRGGGGGGTDRGAASPGISNILRGVEEMQHVLSQASSASGSPMSMPMLPRLGSSQQNNNKGGGGATSARRANTSSSSSSNRPHSHSHSMHFSQTASSSSGLLGSPSHGASHTSNNNSSEDNVALSRLQDRLQVAERDRMLAQDAQRKLAATLEATRRALTKEKQMLEQEVAMLEEENMTLRGRLNEARLGTRSGSSSSGRRTASSSGRRSSSSPKNESDESASLPFIQSFVLGACKEMNLGESDGSNELSLDFDQWMSAEDRARIFDKLMQRLRGKSTSNNAPQNGTDTADSKDNEQADGSAQST